MRGILILAGAPVGWLDRGAGEVAGSIVDRRGPRSVVTAGAIELASARWSHRMVDGRATTTVRLKDGTTIDTEATGAVLNLVRALPTIGFRRSSERDRAYADMELQALFVSFLRSFRCPVVNGVDGQGPLGVWSPLRWSTLAHRCGIDTWPQVHSTGSRLLAPRTSPARVPVAATTVAPSTVVVVGERVIGATSTRLAERCRRLAQLAGCELLGLSFDGATGRMLAADPFPPLAGDVAVEVASLLCRHAAAETGRVAS